MLRNSFKYIHHHFVWFLPVYVFVVLYLHMDYTCIFSIDYIFIVEFNGFIEPSVSNITTYNDDSVYIDCRANTTLPIQLVTWYKNDVRLQPELNRTHITMPDGVLVINNATYSDAGIYKCRLSLVSQFQQRSVEVIIETPTGMLY